MIPGFCFRSPDVIKFLVPAHKYSVCVVPDRERDQALATFDKQAHGNRTRVYIHRSLSALNQCLNNQIHNKLTCIGIHVVCDAYSVLSRRPCVEILDIETKKQATWQLRKTGLPSLLEKVLDRTQPGVTETDRKCLTETSALPEDLVVTDKPTNDAGKHAKTRSFLNVLQQLQAKHADKRDWICFWVCAFYAGMLIDPKHKLKHKHVQGKWSEQKPVPVTTYAEKDDVDACQRMLETVRVKLKERGYELKRSQAQKLVDVLDQNEYVYVMRALLLVREQKLTPEQAVYRTGADVSTTTLLCRTLFQVNSASDPAHAQAKYLSKHVTVPDRARKRVDGDRADKKIVKDEAVIGTETGKKSGNNSTRTHIAPGYYSVLELVRALGVVPQTTTTAQMLALAKNNTTKTSLKKFVVDGKTKYKVIKNVKGWIRFNGIRYRLIGVSGTAGGSSTGNM